MSNLRLKDHTWDAANVYDSTLGKTQAEINAEVGTSLAGKQGTLVSGENIKTVNGASILGEGNIEIQGGGSVTVDDEMSASSENPVQNKVIKARFDAVDTALAGKQATLVSGENVKTINGASILGEGNIEIQGTGEGNVIEIPLQLYWSQGSITSDGGNGTSQNSNYLKRIRTNDRPFRIPAGHKLEFVIPAGLRLTIYYFPENTSYSTSPGHSDWLTGTYTFYGTEQIKYVRLMLAKEDNTNLEPADAAGFSATLFLTDDAFTEKPVSYMDTETATVRGITISKRTDYQFIVSGTPTSTAYYKIFNVLLGADESQDVAIKTPQRNITDPGTYVLFFSTLTDDISFRLTYGGTADSVILKNGSTFEIKDKPATLFVYVNTSASFSSSLYVSWALYKLDDFVNDVPIYSCSWVDSAARAAIKDEKAEIELLKAPKSWGLANALANANQVMSIKWTPIAKMPKHYNPETGELTSYFEQNVQVVGLPYSSVRDQDKAIGMDVSIHTFMTALNDPNSVLYKRISTVGNSGSYYGTVCSGLINVAMGIGLNLTNYYLSDSEMFETVPMQDLEAGDMIWVSGHCAFISNVEKDAYGRITWVTVQEEWSPYPRTIRYSWNNFLENRSRYIARRFKKLNGVEYKSIPYVQCFDETPSNIVYPDVQTEFGDKAVFMVGDDVKINIIDSSGYSTITVTRDSTTVHTTSTIEPFTLSNLQGGLYTITAAGDSKNSVSTFFVVDAVASFDDTTGIVTFSSTNATPVLVGVYDLPSNREILVEDILLTDADRTAGSINVSSYMTATRKYAKVFFKCEYGTAVWYSENHEKWIPYEG